MMATRVTSSSKARRVSFWIAVALTTSFLLLALLASYPLLFTNWLPTDAWLAVRPDRTSGDQVHRLHSMSLGVISWGMLAGVGLQFHQPKRKVGALLMALVAVMAVGCSLVLTGGSVVSAATGIAPFLLLILTVCALHPSAMALAGLPRWNWAMIGLAVLAAGPWGAYALGLSEAALATGPDSDVEHLSFVVSVALMIPLWALVGATDKPGWMYPAGAAVIASAGVGMQSLLFPDALSGLEVSSALAALAWCAAYGSAAVTRARGARVPGSAASH